MPLGALNFYSTFSASVRSVGTAVSMAAVGVYLHQRNFVSSEGKRTLARISQQVTFPLFLFTKICYCNQDWSNEPCPDVTKSLRDVWILLFWPAVVVGVGLSIGYLTAKLARTPQSQFRGVLAACGFGNSTGLPITLLTVVHTNFPSTSDLGKIDPCLFLSVYLLLYPVLQWGVGGWLLAPDEVQENTQTDKSIPSFQAEKTCSSEETTTTTLLSPTAISINRNVLNNKQKESYYRLSRNAIGETDASLYISDADLVSFFSPKPYELPPSKFLSMGRNQPDEAASTTYLGKPETTQPTHIQDDFQQGSGPSSYQPITPDTIGEMLPPDDESTHLLSPGTESPDSSATAARSTASEVQNESLCETCQKVMSRCFQPPVIGALAGIFVAATPLRGIFVDLVDRSSSAPLEWLFDGFYAVGQAAVPINMIILGCNLSASHQSRRNKKEDLECPNVLDRPLPSNLLSRKTMIAIVIAKLLVMPLVGILLALLLDEFVLDIPDDIDASFYLVLMIVFITPTANNVMVMVELSGSNTKEGIAQVIAMQYACAPLMLSLTMSLVVGIASKWD